MNWLLLRGLMREQRHWMEFPQVFTQHLPGAQVFMLDAPGMGTQHAQPSPFTMAGITAHFRQRWDALRQAHPGPWGLLTESLGGMVGLQWCWQWPQDFAALVLMSSSAANLSPLHHRLRPLGLLRLLSVALSRDLTRRELRVLRMVSRGSPHTGDLAKAYAGFLESAPTHVRVALGQLAASAAFQAPPKTGVPTLVLSSVGDEMVSYHCSEALARHLGATLRLHVTAGHDLPLDDGPWVARQVAHWMAAQNA